MKEKKTMTNMTDTEAKIVVPARDSSGSSLVPMLIGGLVLIVIGMVAAFAFS